MLFYFYLGISSLIPLYSFSLVGKYYCCHTQVLKVINQHVETILTKMSRLIKETFSCMSAHLVEN